MQQKARSELLSAQDAAEKKRIMQRILSNDAEIRTLVEPGHPSCESPVDPKALHFVVH